MDEQLQIKEKIKEKYDTITLLGNSESCCTPSSEGCDTDTDTHIPSTTITALR